MLWVGIALAALVFLVVAILLALGLGASAAFGDEMLGYKERVR